MKATSACVPSATPAAQAPGPVSVSVVIPVYNGESFLLEAIGSVRRQGHSPLEIIVVDDGSTDRSAGIATGLGDAVRYVRQDNMGAAGARNRGIRMATGAVIAFLDADDVWSEHKLALQLAHLRADPSLELVRGYTQRIRLAARDNGESVWEEYDQPWAALSLGSAVMRRAAFEKVGYLDETLAVQRGCRLVPEGEGNMYRNPGARKRGPALPASRTAT